MIYTLLQRSVFENPTEFRQTFLHFAGLLNFVFKISLIFYNCCPEVTNVDEEFPEFQCFETIFSEDCERRSKSSRFSFFLRFRNYVFFQFQKNRAALNKVANLAANKLIIFCRCWKSTQVVRAGTAEVAPKLVRRTSFRDSSAAWAQATQVCVDAQNMRVVLQRILRRVLSTARLLRNSKRFGLPHTKRTLQWTIRAQMILKAPTKLTFEEVENPILR